ncbi:MAG TPA: S8 family serine peptidase, partial [Bryobacteraceae bacterium]|nr:S8 family serine peptidase [Bryobacteraceae bacterium]
MVTISRLLAVAIPLALSVQAQSKVPSAAHLSVGSKAIQGLPGKKLARDVAKTGQVDIVIRLADPPLLAASGTRRLGIRMTPAEQNAYLQQLQQKQSTLIAQAASQGAREIARLTRATNGVIVSIDRSRVETLRGIPGVISVREVPDYQQALSTVRDHIGASALHAAGVTGAGITIAVLDSGIDYTHKNLGGPGTIAAYQAAAGAPAYPGAHQTRDGLFPTAKVYEGFDFVGEVWPNAARQPDPDPIDRGGHGTHVADIAAGKSTDGAHRGIAPDAKLLAVKVCSAVSTSCSGVATLLGIDYAADPDRDTKTADAVDVINLSLGSDFGMREDDATEALRLLSRAGVVVVVSAGNGGNIPFILGAPAAGTALITVGQTTLPSETNIGLQINTPDAIKGMYRNTAT